MLDSSRGDATAEPADGRENRGSGLPDVTPAEADAAQRRERQRALLRAENQILEQALLLEEQLDGVDPLALELATG